MERRLDVHCLEMESLIKFLQFSKCQLFERCWTQNQTKLSFPLHWFSPLALITKLNGKQLWNIEELCQINKWCLPWSHCNFCKGAKIDASGYKTLKEQSHCVKIYNSPKSKGGFVVNFELFGKVKMFVAWAISF